MRQFFCARLRAQNPDFSRPGFLRQRRTLFPRPDFFLCTKKTTTTTKKPPPQQPHRKKMSKFLKACGNWIFDSCLPHRLAVMWMVATVVDIGLEVSFNTAGGKNKKDEERPTFGTHAWHGFQTAAFVASLPISLPALVIAILANQAVRENMIANTKAAAATASAAAAAAAEAVKQE
jgi:hypothetical protein